MGKPATMSTRRVAVGDHEFLLNESGDPDAESVLFLHGSGPGATGESNWRAVLEDMGDEYRCLAPDVMGYGDSSHPNPPPQGILPFTQFRVDTLLQLLDTLGIEKTTLVGNSMGGIISLSIVRQAPERINKIVLMGSGGAPLPPGSGLPALINFYQNPSTEAMVHVLETMIYDRNQFGDELDDIAAARLPRATRPDVQRSHLATFDLTIPWVITDEELAAITQEVLIVHGREDAVLNFADSLWYFNRIPNARLYGIGKCGHWTQIEHHKNFVSVVRGFLAGAL
jgi:2-hydroxymuconate-semialdehyde hydrolase